jgi:hypothetical protein
VFAENTFTFTSGGGGGGGCTLAQVDAPAPPRAWLENGWWLLAVLGWLLLRSRTRRTARPCV